MRWFLQRANGGDILVLRTSGSDGYNDYLYSSLGVPVNSVETIVCHNADASEDPYVHQKIQQAEAIWFAGGDQWTYVSYWRNTAIDSLINRAIQNRKIVIGGTSAGMAIQGKYYFSAQYGTVSSATALSDPFNELLTVDSASFLQNNFLEEVITDTHFDNPDRKGRLLAFLARMYSSYGVQSKAIACDEYTAVCIDTHGIAKVFGAHPSYDDNAYFIQSNCELDDPSPENCSDGNPLTWNHGGEALKVYQVKGTETGSHTFDLNTWQSGIGGSWQNWSADAGAFQEQPGNQIHCSPLTSIDGHNEIELKVYPNPASDRIIIHSTHENTANCKVKLFNSSGQLIPSAINRVSEHQLEIDLSEMSTGMYFLMITTNKQINYIRVFTIK